MHIDKGSKLYFNIDKNLKSYIPRWELKGKLSAKTYGKFIIIGSNRNGFTYLAKEADSFTGIKDEESYSCDDHVHIGYFDETDKIGTDFWYYYQSDEGY